MPFATGNPNMITNIGIQLPVEILNTDIGRRKKHVVVKPIHIPRSAPQSFRCTRTSSNDTNKRRILVVHE